MLEQFDMNDELYIQNEFTWTFINSIRELQSFNRKVMKDEKHDKKYTTFMDKQISHFGCILQQRLMHVGLICFGEKIDDASLIKTNDNAIGFRYFRFFNRYLFSKAAQQFAYSQNNRDSTVDFFLCYYTTKG